MTRCSAPPSETWETTSETTGDGLHAAASPSRWLARPPPEAIGY